jgi:hypothetical protein
MEPNAHLEEGPTMPAHVHDDACLNPDTLQCDHRPDPRFQLHQRVTLTPAMLHYLSADVWPSSPPASAYALGYIEEIAEATGIPTSGTLYRVRWYSPRQGLRTIFRESELVPVGYGPGHQYWSAEQDALRTVQDDTFDTSHLTADGTDWRTGLRPDRTVPGRQGLQTIFRENISLLPVPLVENVDGFDWHLGERA